MRFVVDTNILFSFFWQNSIIKKFLENPNFQFYSPELAIKELEKYSDLIIKKTRMTRSEFNDGLDQLKNTIKFVEKKEFLGFLKAVENISPDKDDEDFLALFLKLNLPLWSNDKELKKQDKVSVFSTEEILGLFDFY